MLSIKNSVEKAFKNSSESELKAIIYLSLGCDKKLSKNYLKSLKKLGKYQRKLKKLIESGRDEFNSELLENDKKLQHLIKNQKECIKEVREKEEINNTELISRRLVKEYKQGFGIIDSVRGIRNKDSSYGRVVYKLLEKIASESPITRIKKLIKKEKSFNQKMRSENPQVSNIEYVDSEEGAEYIELQFMLYYLDKMTEDYSLDQKEGLIEDLIKEIARDNAAEKDKLIKMYKSGQLGRNFSKIVLQIIRYSVGKGIFMNTAVKVTNMTLRIIIGKGMSYGRNAAFRKVVAKFLSSGGETPITIIFAIIMVIPDLFLIFNPRNYLGLTNTIISLYLLRNYSDQEST